MNDQGAIEFVPVSPVVHRDDPHTSTISARRVTRSGERKRQAEEVLAALKKWQRAYVVSGITSAELALLSGLDRFVCGRRLPELADPANGGLVERGEARVCNVTGYKSTIWRAR